MARYRNPKHELEAQETEQVEKELEVYKEPAKNVEDEVWKKRAADKDRYINQLKTEHRQRMDDLERKLDQALRGQLKAPKSNEDVELWMKEYPEFAGILETIVQTRIKEATSKTEEKIEQLSRREAEIEYERAINRLRKIHPDLDELSKDEAFHNWLSSRPESDQEVIYRSIDVDKADLVITKYKAEKGKIKSKVDEDEPRDTRKDAAKVVSVKTKASEPVDDFGDYEFTESQIERESKRNKKWFEQNEEKIISAARRGKILYDVSGGAR
jgi:exonuclease VII large subunit